MALKYKEDTVNNYYAYLTEDGVDTNSGLTPALPVKTMDRLVEVLTAYAGTKRRHAVIVKHKFKNESITTTRINGRPITFEHLNRTIYEQDSNNIVFGVSTSGDVIINAITDYNFLNGLTFQTAQRIIFDSDGASEFTTSGIAARNTIYDRCVFNSCKLKIMSKYATFRKCIFDGCRNFQPGNIYINPSSIRNSIIINCPDLYFYTSNGNSLYNCNVYGNILLDGTSRNNTYLQTVGWNINGISADPLFNDSANGVYTVTNLSPCLYAGSNNQHIGIGEAFYLTGLELLTDAVSSSNLEASGNKLIRTNSDNDASLETKIFDIRSYRIISLVDLAATLGFVLDDLVQSVQLDSADNPYPYFLTFKIKVSDTSGGIATAPWIVLPFQQQPTTDLDGVGNGSTVWDETETQEYVKARYLKLYIYVQNLT